MIALDELAAPDTVREAIREVYDRLEKIDPLKGVKVTRAVEENGMVFFLGTNGAPVMWMPGDVFDEFRAAIDPPPKRDLAAEVEALLSKLEMGMNRHERRAAKAIVRRDRR